MVTCIVGINWGDEGKGRVADLLSRDMDIVCRCQGTSEARHTVVNERGSFMLNQLPSGILYGGVCCIMGDGMYIQPDRLDEEITRLRDAGVDISPENLKISRRAALVLPGLTAAQMRLLLETRDRLCMGDLTDVEMLAEHLNALADAFRRYGGKPNMSAWSACCRRYTALFGDYIADTGAYLYDAEHAGKRILLESQSGALRDKDFGVFPYGSPTNCLAAYTPIGAGMPGVRLSRVVGVMKAYSACHGDGPFPAEITGEEATYFRELGQEDEDGATPRRVGGFDAVASRYGVRLQGVDAIALTKLDAVSFLPQIPICVAYEVDGKRVTDFPTPSALRCAKPIYEYVDGWNCDISGCRAFADLPVQAIIYIRYLEELVGAPITYVSVGAERDAYIRDSVKAEIQ